MPKKIISVIVLLFSLLVTGCTSSDLPFLEYQSKGFEAVATLEINSEKYSVSITKSEDGIYKLCFDSPDSIKGVSIEKDGDSLTFSTGNVHIPLKDGSNISAQCLKLFEFSKDDLVSTEATMLNGVKVNTMSFNNDYGNAKLYISTDSNLPVLIEADIDGNSVVMSFSSFKTVVYTEDTSLQ